MEVESFPISNAMYAGGVIFTSNFGATESIPRCYTRNESLMKKITGEILYLQFLWGSSCSEEINHKLNIVREPIDLPYLATSIVCVFFVP